MILDLDIGNTLSKWRLKSLEQDKIIERGSVWTRDRWDGSQELPDFRDLKAIRISNVAGKDILRKVERLAKRYRVKLYVARSCEESAGVRNGYQRPEALGVDRWMGVLAGYHALGGCCVIDCGSAITMDFVLPDGQHLGGFITPGMRLMKESLKLGTSNVPFQQDDTYQGLTVPGTSTQEAVTHGIFLAAVGQIALAYDQFCQSQKQKLPIILTGGDADLIRRGLSANAYRWPDMVYAGLELIFPLTALERQGQLYGAPVRAKIIEKVVFA